MHVDTHREQQISDRSSLDGSPLLDLVASFTIQDVKTQLVIASKSKRAQKYPESLGPYRATVCKRMDTVHSYETIISVLMSPVCVFLQGESLRNLIVSEAADWQVLMLRLAVQLRALRNSTTESGGESSGCKQVCISN